MQALLLPQPSYNGPQRITYFNDVKTFREEVSKAKKGYWLIEFYTLWNSSCVDFASIFAELSHKYDCLYYYIQYSIVLLYDLIVFTKSLRTVRKLQDTGLYSVTLT